MLTEKNELSVYDTIKRSGGFPVMCGHRGGCSAFGPENTMYSFRRSVAFGVQLLEIDLHVTKDKQLVLIHDDDVDRTTNGKGDVCDFSLEELKKLDAAFLYDDLRGTGIKIPTFQEFLDDFYPIPNLIFMLDFKDAISIEMTLEVVKNLKMESRIILGSCDTDCNTLLSKLKPPSVPLITDVYSTVVIITAYMAGCLDWYTFEHKIFGFILIPSTTIFWSKGLIDAIHQAGCQILVCGEELDKIERQRECIEYGVEFIMSDRPDILKQTLESFKLERSTI